MNQDTQNHTLEPCAYNPFAGVVAGQWYRAEFFNGPFEFWVSRKLSRKEARQAALEFANGDYVDVYTDEDLESVRAIAGPGDLS